MNPQNPTRKRDFDKTFHNPQLLRVFLYYRLSIGLILYLAFVLDLAPNILGSRSPTLFHQVSFGYTLLCLGSFFVFRVDQLTHSKKRISFLLTLDIVALVLMIHASGGVETSLGYLLLVSAAMSSIFLRGRIALAYAAFIFFLVFGDSLYLGLQEDNMTKRLFTSGTLGFLVFFATISFNYLTEKIRISDLAAFERARHAAHLQRLAQHIVTRMRTGIIVLNEQTSIELINESAMQMLDLPAKLMVTGKKVGEISNLDEIVHEWQRNPAAGITRVHRLRAGQEARISFARMDSEEAPRTVLYLEDYRAITQHAQQLKLASLGRLTGSIAHEVRNPLGAISHAAQLLSESTELDKADRRLTEIILQHSARVNQIIQNTLQISSRKEPKPQQIELGEWLIKFKHEYCQPKNSTIELHIDKEIAAKFDPIHLHQVLTNLCDNGCRYSEIITGNPRVVIHANVSENEDLPYIEVVDDGPGISPDALSQIFDPFYTTDEQGSGLGLYISKELCENNQANLYFKRTPEGKSCFRISFSHHQRMI